MQPGQVAPNQNFLTRPPGPIPVSHGNVQQQVSPPPPTNTVLSACRCPPPLPRLVHACMLY